jgi:hypothetical protein
MSHAETLMSHPIHKFLADDLADIERDHHVELVEHDFDLSDLESLMETEDENARLGLGKVRSTEVDSPLKPVPELRGTLNSRLNCLLDETVGCITQAEWREKAKVHPAYELIYAELREAFFAGTMDRTFDSMEKFGVEVYFDRSCNLLTLGLSMTKMRAGFGEVIVMKDLRNKRALDIINEVGFGLLKDEETKPESIAPQTATFYITFQLGYNS